MQNRETNLKIGDTTLGLPPENLYYCQESFGNSPSSGHISPFASNSGSQLGSPIHQTNMMYNQIQNLGLITGNNTPIIPPMYSAANMFSGSGQNSPVYGNYAYNNQATLNQPTSVSSITQGEKK